MNLKKKLGMGIMSAALGASLIGGGTVAYFSDTVESTNTFAAGTLDLSVKPEVVVNVKNLKPGDTMLREFKLKNDGSLDIPSVLLDADYTVVDAKEDNAGADFGDHIKVKFLWNWDKNSEYVTEMTLAELRDADVVDIVSKTGEAADWAEKGGLKAGKKDTLWVEFSFEDKEDQNVFQGDSLNLNLTFEGKQGEGEKK